ncbi:DUF1127 domain-containing protein [Pseudomonas huanghezhanensis]|uniref:DUF1127 domain-containing protein n=1 Tax=Pseudomonas huanghezhanensis TaxID=3002903 RepID=UPI0022863D02|nr:DUF1127 domain-containing protein [Pseudomonas sp. BSw22131]
MKSQKGYVLVLKTLSRDSFVERAFSSLVGHMRRWLQLHRERRQLASMSDDALKDIGLSRADVLQEVERPFWDDPMKH